MPAFSTLLANSAGKVLGNLCPLFGSSLLDKLDDQLVLELSPRALDELRVEYFLPSVQTLYVGASFELARDLLPLPFPSKTWGRCKGSRMCVPRPSRRRD